MAWFWALVLAGVAAFTSVVKAPRVRRLARRTALALALVFALSAALWLFARSEARGAETPRADVFGWVALALQAGIAIVVVRQFSRSGNRTRLVQVAGAFGVVLLVALLILLVDVDLPDWLAVVGVSLAAVRASRLTVRSTAGGIDRGAYVANCALVVWTAVVLSLETGLLGRSGGLTIAVSSVLAGLATLFFIERGDSLIRRTMLSTASAAVGIALVFAAWVLAPSHASLRWLHHNQFEQPASFTLAGERYDEGLTLQRWYDTTLDPGRAQLAVHRGFGGLVSEWANDESPFDIDAVVLGYQFNVRIWDANGVITDRPPSSRLCHTETGSCVLVELRRSDEHGDGTKPLRLGDSDSAD
jgi:hypothetical protein